MKKIVYCPVCHQRLFDADVPSGGEIEIKCPRCRGVQHIILLKPEKETLYPEGWEKTTT